MIIPNQKIEISINISNLNHYRDLGYNVKIKDKIIVTPEELPKSSRYRVHVVCDICGEELCEGRGVTWDNYNHQKTDFGDVCYNCKKHKMKDTNLKIWGTTCSLHNSEVHQKTITTNLKRYGTEHCLASPIIRERIEQTNMIKYNSRSPFSDPIIQEKIKNTMLELYGVDNPMKSEEIRERVEQTNLKRYNATSPNKTLQVREKTKQTSLQRYGVSCPLNLPENQKRAHSPEAKEKSLRTFLSNGNNQIPTSKQQIELYNNLKEIYDNVELNYQFGYYVLDCKLEIKNHKIDIEYDGDYWHQNESKDRAHNTYLINHGFNVIRFRGRTKIPTKEQIVEAVNSIINNETNFILITLEDCKYFYH